MIAVLFAAALSTVTAAATVPASARHFRIDQTIEVPAGPAATMVLVPVPQDGEWQKIVSTSLAKAEIIRDQRGNEAARYQVPAQGGTLAVSFEIERRERTADLSRATGKSGTGGNEQWLGNDQLVKVDDRIRKLSAEVTAGAKTPIEKARKVYDYVLSTMKYQKTGDGWGNGSIEWACDQKYGNCTDFHALFIGLMRAANVPARFEIGRSIPPQSGPVAGYHCWADFWVDGAGWIPVDASEAWKHPEKRDYFFGHHDADRFALSQGRDLVFPGLPGPALNYFVDPVAESGGARVKVKQTTTITAL